MSPSDWLMQDTCYGKRNDTNTYVYITVVDNEININSKLHYLFKCLECTHPDFLSKEICDSLDQSVRINLALKHYVYFAITR